MLKGALLTNSIVSVVIVTVVSLLFIFYFIFMAPDSYMGKVNPQKSAFSSPESHSLKGFDVVSRKLLYKHQRAESSEETYYDLGSLPNILLDTDDKDC